MNGKAHPPTVTSWRGCASVGMWEYQKKGKGCTRSKIDIKRQELRKICYICERWPYSPSKYSESVFALPNSKVWKIFLSRQLTRHSARTRCCRVTFCDSSYPPSVGFLPFSLLRVLPAPRVWGYEWAPHFCFVFASEPSTIVMVMRFLSRINYDLTPEDRPQAFYNIVALIGIPWLVYKIVGKLLSEAPPMVFAILAAIIVGGAMYAYKTGGGRASSSLFRELLLCILIPITGIFAWPWILILDIITLIRG